MQNQWLSANLAGIEKIRRLLTEWEYKPIFQDYPLKTIQLVLRGFEVEVNKLQEQVNNLKKENEELKNEIKKNSEAVIKDA